MPVFPVVIRGLTVCAFVLTELARDQRLPFFLWSEGVLQRLLSFLIIMDTTILPSELVKPLSKRYCIKVFVDSGECYGARALNRGQLVPGRGLGQLIGRALRL